VNVVYDATPLLMRSAGVKNYHHALLKALIPSFSPHRIRLFPFLTTLKPNQNERSNYPPISTALRLGAVLTSNYSGLSLASLVTRRAHLFHATQHSWRLPRGVCLTSQVHDPTPLTLPSCHTASTIRYFKNFVDNTLPKLARILVPSNAVKKDLAEQFRIPPEKITVVHHGVDEDFFSSSDAARYLVRQKYGLPEKFILFVGAMEPRKNLKTVVAAYSSMRDELKNTYPLVIAGATGWKSAGIRRLVAKAQRVILTGYVRRSLLPALYHCASLFVFPSLYEGFGMPLTEAMAARLPIVASNRGAIPEIVGDAAILADPLSVSDIATGMERILETPAIASALGETGRQLARRFTWKETAAQTKAFFEQALGGLGA
jgi:glycosyltransferase involved in cell wall biosynthesis